MKIDPIRVLDRLPAEEPCHGALFTSYSFDPSFFEEHILRAVLRLKSDPVEQAERYHHEARRALQETPVVAIVDAAERRPGRRLPFDLLDVPYVVFHPKAVLLLYRNYARLQIGSGNLTSSGYGGNTELFLCVDLAYNKAADAALLLAFDEHLDRLLRFVRRSGTQLDLFREELKRRVQPVSSHTRAGDIVFLDSTTGPILEQFAALLPDEAVITSLGMLAPFYERDDATELDVTSVFGALTPWIGEDTVLDVGVAWDNPQVHPSDMSRLQDGCGHLWTSVSDNGVTQTLNHLVLTSIGPKTVGYIDEAGQGRRCPLDEVLEALDQRTLWMQPSPVAFAPHNAVMSAAKRFSEVRLWLHPATQLVDGHPIHRPLHAKLLVAGFRAGRSQGTLVLMGSPNMSRRALLMPAGVRQGNVEVAFAFRLDSSLLLRDFVPDLVYAPLSALELQERQFPELGPNHALAIDEASHDPGTKSLCVTWSPEATDLPPWCLTYDGQRLAHSDTAPTTPLRVADFVLKPSTAELILHVDGREYPIPILVTDLAALPATPASPALNLDELLLLLGGRIGAERAILIAERRATGTSDSNGDEPSLFFGEGFGPTDVFRAWWAVANELKDSSLSVPGFRLRLEGALGVGAAWSCMCEAISRESLPVEEVWFYGAELLRTLTKIELPPADDQTAKIRLLSTFRKKIRRDLERLGLDAGTRSWAERIRSFYGEVET